MDLQKEEYITLVKALLPHDLFKYFKIVKVEIDDDAKDISFFLFRVAKIYA